MEYLYDYMDSSGNIYVVVQDDDNNVLTLTADEYDERVHQEKIRRPTHIIHRIILTADEYNAHQENIRRKTL